MYIVIGTCSLCGGQVVVPKDWNAVIPAIPTCLTCGAVAALHGRVIPMMPRPGPDYNGPVTCSVYVGKAED